MFFNNISSPEQLSALCSSELLLDNCDWIKKFKQLTFFCLNTQDVWLRLCPLWDRSGNVRLPTEKCLSVACHWAYYHIQPCQQLEDTSWMHIHSVPPNTYYNKAYLHILRHDLRWFNHKVKLQVKVYIRLNTKAPECFYESVPQKIQYSLINLILWGCLSSRSTLWEAEAQSALLIDSLVTALLRLHSYVSLAIHNCLSYLLSAAPFPSILPT